MIDWLLWLLILLVIFVVFLMVKKVFSMLLLGALALVLVLGIVAFWFGLV